MKSVALAVALVALAACSPAPAETTEAPATPRARPGAIAGEGITFAAADLYDIVSDADAPSGLTLDGFWLDAPVGEVTPETVEYFAAGSFTLSQCESQALLVELASQDDTAAVTDESIAYLFEYGVAFGVSWTTAAISSARVFADAADAASFLDAGEFAASQCTGGYTFVASNDAAFEVASVTLDDALSGYPDDVRTTLMVTAFPDSETQSLFIQYGNVVVSVRLDKSAEIVQPPDRIHEIGRLLAERLVERGAKSG